MKLNLLIRNTKELFHFGLFELKSLQVHETFLDNYL